MWAEPSAGWHPFSVVTGIVWATLVGVMVINLLAMLAARAVMHGLFVLGMRILGAVLGVLQVALAVQIMLHGLRGIGVLT